MSGPKTSEYFLTSEQRAELERQREIQRRKMVAVETIQRCTNKVMAMQGDFAEEVAVARELIDSGDTDGGLANKINELNGILSPLEKAVLRANADTLELLEEAAVLAEKTVSDAKKLKSEIAQINASNRSKLKSTLNADIDKGLGSSFADLKDTLTVHKDALNEKLDELLSYDFFSKEVVAEINNAKQELSSINDETTLKSFSAITTTPLIKKCAELVAEYEQYSEKFDALISEYAALCKLYHLVEQEYSCSVGSIAELKSEIQRIKTEAANDDEQSYISECIDEVMEEMGYTVLGSREVRKKNGKRFRNELYSYSDGTAINVTYSADGKIAMELGGMDTADRLPDEQESSVLCGAMESFCGDFKEIEKRLAAKGVILSKRISMLPPSEEYAQIINTSEYSMENEAEMFKTKRQRRSANTSKVKEMK